MFATWVIFLNSATVQDFSNSSLVDRYFMNFVTKRIQISKV